MREYDYRERKTVILLASNNEAPTNLNIVGHLSLAIGAWGDDMMGRPELIDGSGIVHRGISRYPVILLKGRMSKVRNAIQLCRDSQLLHIEYPREMLTTGHDDELASELAARDESMLEYLGVAAHGATSDVDAIFGRFTLWRED